MAAYYRLRWSTSTELTRLAAASWKFRTEQEILRACRRLFVVTKESLGAGPYRRIVREVSEVAKMLSQAGEMAVLLKDVVLEDHALVLVSQMGVWDSRIVVGFDEALAIARLILRPRIIMFLLRGLLHKLFYRTKHVE